MIKIEIEHLEQEKLAQLPIYFNLGNSLTEAKWKSALSPIKVNFGNSLIFESLKIALAPIVSRLLRLIFK